MMRQSKENKPQEQTEPRRRPGEKQGQQKAKDQRELEAPLLVQEQLLNKKPTK
jgi:hypothetical protein